MNSADAWKHRSSASEKTLKNLYVLKKRLQRKERERERERKRERETDRDREIKKKKKESETTDTRKKSRCVPLNPTHGPKQHEQS